MDYRNLDDAALSIASTESGPRSGRKSLSRILFALVFAGLLLSLIVVSALYSKERSKHNDEGGTSEDGDAAGLSEKEIERISSMVDWSAGPCEDFYNYACGSWKAPETVVISKFHNELLCLVACHNYLTLFLHLTRLSVLVGFAFQASRYLASFGEVADRTVQEQVRVR